jgi:hypothetical protein
MSEQTPPTVPSPVSDLMTYIKLTHPQADVDLDTTLMRDVWFIDITCDETCVTVEWSLATGFGVSKLAADLGYGERPDETFATGDQAQRRITELLEVVQNG